MQNSIFTMPTLPTELITEILSRLPVKSLLQLRSVSKSWLALISRPQFVKTHLTISAKKHRVVFTEVRNLFTCHNVQYILRDCSLTSLRNDSVIDAFDLDYPMNNPQQKVSFVGSVNGLICLAIKDNDLVLWNPSIRLFKQLPHSGLKLELSSGYNSPTNVIYGFGYDESNDDYKLVGVLCTDKFPILQHIKVEIYSLKSNSWKSMDDIPDAVRLAKPCTFVNGKLHLVGEINWGDWNIISVNLADEKLEKVEQPRYGEGDFSLKLEVFGSDLSVFCNYVTSHTDLWVMREYGVKESWIKMYTFKYPGYEWSPFISKTLCMSNKGDILLVPGSTLMVHNPEDEPIKYPKVTKFGFCVAVNIYIESLVCAPLYGTNKAQKKNEGCRRSDE